MFLGFVKSKTDFWPDDDTEGWIVFPFSNMDTFHFSSLLYVWPLTNTHGENETERLMLKMLENGIVKAEMMR